MATEYTVNFKSDIEKALKQSLKIDTGSIAKAIRDGLKKENIGAELDTKKVSKEIVRSFVSNFSEELSSKADSGNVSNNDIDKLIVSSINKATSKTKSEFDPKVSKLLGDVLTKSVSDNKEIVNKITDLVSKFSKLNDRLKSISDNMKKISDLKPSDSTGFSKLFNLISKLEGAVTRFSDATDKLSATGGSNEHIKTFLTELSESVKQTTKQSTTKDLKAVTAGDIQKAVVDEVNKKLKLDISKGDFGKALGALETKIDSASANKEQIKELVTTLDNLRLEDKGTELFKGLRSRLSGTLEKITDLKKVLSIELKIDSGSKTAAIKEIDDIGKSKEVPLKLKIDRKESNKLRDQIRKNTSSLAHPELYKEQVVKPFKPGSFATGTMRGVDISKTTREMQNTFEKNLKGLSESLFTLQEKIIESLEENLQSGWEVAKSPGKKSPKDVFSRQPGGRSWSAEVVDMTRLRKKLGVSSKPNEDVKQMLDQYKSKLIDEYSRKTDDFSKSKKIVNWSMTSDNREIDEAGLSNDIKRKLKNFKSQKPNLEEIDKFAERLQKKLGDSLEQVFKSTAAVSHAERKAAWTRDEEAGGVVRKVSVPAAFSTPTGSSVIKTQHGSEKSLSKFVKFETGVEKLYDKLVESSKSSNKEVAKFATKAAGELKERVRNAELLPKSSKDLANVEDLSKTLIEKAFGVVGKGRGEEEARKKVADYYKRAVDLREKKAVSGTEYEKTLVKEQRPRIKETLSGFESGDIKNFDEFSKKMEELNISAYNVIRTFDSLEEINFYDIISKLVGGEDEKSPLRKFSKKPSYDREFRNLSKTMVEAEGLMPLHSRSDPRRGYHQENVTNVLTRTSDAYSGGKSVRLGPEKQKQYIKDLNKAVSNVLEKDKMLGEKSVGFKNLSTVGIPEHQASQFSELRKSGGTSGARSLEALNATALKMYSENLASQAPFEQFQHLGRNIASTTKARPASEKSKFNMEYPKLRSERETELIRGGKFSGKYGVNVVSELRNTASNFEDQIVIAGRLADILTETASTLVKPGPDQGRGTSLLETNKEISNKDVEKANAKYMEILGVDKTFKSRADTINIKDDLTRALETVRDKDLEVQKATVAETFMNYYGRKLTTRYGSKGVAVTPGNPLTEALSDPGKGEVKVDKSADLGKMLSPKSMGELVSELFGDNISDKLKQQLLESGNKFIIDLFQDTESGIVTEREAEKNAFVYKRFKNAWNEVFKEGAPEVGIGGIEKIKEKYKSKMGDSDLYKEKPIEVRISSYGAAKRGLQPEFLETITNNLVSTSGDTSTTLRSLKPEQYNELLGGGGLSKYSKALGFKGVDKPEGEIAQDLFERFGGKGIVSEALGGEDVKNKEKAEQALRAAKLEAESSFYSTIIDASGKKRTGLAGEKFLSIIEEPHLNPEWSKEQIRTGEKGARLNIPAMSSYSTIFGKDSALMGELSSSLSETSKKHLEYLKALKSMSENSKSVLEGLRSFDASDFDTFDPSTGLMDYERDEKGKKHINSFVDTIMDVDKYPSAFKLNLPRIKTEGDKLVRDEEKKDSVYIPSAAGRVTYPEELISGQSGLDEITRRINHLINMASELEKVTSTDSLVNLDLSSASRKITTEVGSLVGEAWDVTGSKSGKNIKDVSSAGFERLNKIFDRLYSALSKERRPEKSLTGNVQYDNEIEAINNLYKSHKEDLLRSEKFAIKKEDTPEKVEEKQRIIDGQTLSRTISSMSDLLVGPKAPKGGKESEDQKRERLSLRTALDEARDLDLEGVNDLAGNLGVNLKKLEIENADVSLQRAKVDYFKNLAEKMVGKKGSIDELFFTKKIPSVMAKAVTGVVDKKTDIKGLKTTLSGISKKTGIDFSSEAEKLDDVLSKHSSAINDLINKGMPVLKQSEIGIPEGYAKKLPTTFKKGSIKDGAFEVGEEVEGTLYDLLKHRESLQKRSTELKEGELPNLKKFMSEELSPHIESIRFPFTGSSSIAPFKARMLEEGEYGGKAKHSFIVPGIPEGMEGIDNVVDSLESKLYGLVEQRELLHEEGGSPDEISKLTNNINELSRAISDIIPKYTSQAQKLDFDGDEIELHTAKTKEARKDISEHFKKFNSIGQSSTADVWRRKMSAEGAGVKTTSDAVLGEALASFENKFDPSKGFEFLRKPFLTKDLEYLSDTESLDTLSSGYGKGSKVSIIEDTLKGANVKDEIVKEVADSLSGLDDSSEAIMKKLEDSFSDIKPIVEKGIKKKLYESKMDDVIEAQLKSHIGSETEAMYRVNRAFESVIGFGGGELGKGTSKGTKGSDYLKDRFSGLKSFSVKDIEQEFSTMVNEMLRFGIQQGMDVKHAGEKPVAGEMVRSLSSGTSGASSLWEEIQLGKEGKFSDLKDFSEANKEALNYKLGGMPTKDLKSDLESIYKSRGKDTNALGGLNRDEIKDEIIKYIGFEGFLKELTLIMREAAIEGLSKTYSKDKSKAGKDVRALAEADIDKKISEGNFSLLDTFTEGEMPLYGFRSSSANIDKYKSKNIKLPSYIKDVKDSGVRKELKEKYGKAFSVNEELTKVLSTSGQLSGKGTYSDMISSTFKTLGEQQKKIKNIVDDYGLESFESSVPKEDYLDRLSTGEGIDPFSKEVLNLDKKTMKKKVKSFSEQLGVPELPLLRERDLEYKLTKDIKGMAEASGKEGEEEIDKYVNDQLEKVYALAQLDKIVDVMLSQKSSGKALVDLFTGIGSGTRGSTKEFDKTRTDKSSDPRSEGIFLKPPGGIGGGTAQPNAQLPSSSDGPVPVFITGANPSTEISVRGLGNTIDFFKDPVIYENEKRDKRVEELFSKGLSGAETTSGGKSFKDYIGASSLGYSSDELAELLQSSSRDDDSNIHTKLGDVIHEIIQRKLKASGDNIETELYGKKDLGEYGTISGSADVVEYDANNEIKKIVDIKTKASKFMEDLKEVMSGKESVSYNEIKDKLEKYPDIFESLNKAISQVNAYLNIQTGEGSKATGEIRFYDKLGDLEEHKSVTFGKDEKRFESDLKKLKEVRDQIAQGGGEFGSKVSGGGKGFELPDKELDELFDLLKSQYSSKFGGYSTKTRMTGLKTGLKKTKTESGVDKDFSNLTSSELDEYLKPHKIAEGSDAESLFQNLTTLHKQSKLYQKMKGLDSSSLNKLPDVLKGQISETSVSGPDYKTFIDTIDKLRDAEKIGMGDVLSAWKHYRAAVGDWYISEAKKAKELHDSLREEGKPDEAIDAYGDFVKTTHDFQDKIRKSVGKKTDIYTDDKRFVYPKLAESAGVYMSPQEIMNKVGEPLGNDEVLRKSFDDFRKNLLSGEDTSLDQVRDLFGDFSNVNKEFVSILSDVEKFERAGEEVIEAWDFKTLIDRVVRFRAALEQVRKENKELTAEQSSNLNQLIKRFKGLENTYSNISFKEPDTWGRMGIKPVSKFLDPRSQRALNRRNISAAEKYFRKPASEGGPEVGERFTYKEKVFGDTGDVKTSKLQHFQKYGEVITNTGERIGKFTKKEEDLIKAMQESRSSFKAATRRVVMWGAASRLVYGGVNNLHQSLDKLADIEVGLASLRMVMNPLETDFDKLRDSAVDFGKKYGTEVSDVLRGMKIFAQQGLKQAEVIDRTRTATLAANVSTLDAKDATEALTASMKIFKSEGESAERFLDSWSEIEAQHAITAEDMANGIKKSAAAAKTAGFTFDELNGIIASIGSVTRQSGKEVGTALRFIFRRLSAEKGPKALAKLDIPVMDETGNLRKGFDVMSDLSDKWKDLSSFQKMDTARSLGGTRRYNDIIVLMDNWSEAIEAVEHSINSKGSAERRNVEIMKTYAKQLQQTKAAATELQMELGKVVLPAFKGGLAVSKALLETLSDIPGPVKAIGAMMALFVSYAAKGLSITEGITSTFDKGSVHVSNFAGELKEQLKMAQFEITGTGMDASKMYKPSVITGEAQERSGGKNVGVANELTDLQSSFGQLTYLGTEVGRGFNKLVSDTMMGVGDATQSVGESLRKAGQYPSFAADLVYGKDGEKVPGIGDFSDISAKAAGARGLGKEAVKETLSTQGLFKGGAKILGKSSLLAGEITGFLTSTIGEMLDSAGEGMSSAGNFGLKEFVQDNPSLAKSLGPMLLTGAALTPAVKAMYEYWQKITSSAQEYEQSIASVRRSHDGNLKDLRSVSSEYDRLKDRVKDVQESRQPDVKNRRQTLETYTSPLTALQKIQEDITDTSNKTASVNSNLIAGYDELGNAIVKTTGNLKDYFKELERINVKKSIGVELEALDKFVYDLSTVEGPEKWKKTVKDLLDSMPVVGGMLSENIKRSPASVLDEASKGINKMMSLRSEAPLSTAADKDLEELQKKLKSARSAYMDTFSDFNRIYSKIISPSSLRGLTDKDVEEILSSDAMKKAYELKLEVDPKFKLVEGVTQEDLMGQIFLKSRNRSFSELIGETADFTKANLESAGIKERDGLLKSGDIVTLIAGTDKAREVAGRQAIAKFDELQGWVLEYFSKDTNRIERMEVDKGVIENIAESIFPHDLIREKVEERMNALNTFMTGAGSGIVGLDAKAFKKDFDLGSRFFSGLSSSSLIQTSKGFSPSSGFGEVDLKKNWNDEINKYFFEPMGEFKRKAENLGNLKLEGLKDSTISGEIYDELDKLVQVLQNNQLALQFRSLYADLEKSFAEGERVLKEGLEVNQVRRKYGKTTGGILSGVSPDLMNVDLGKQDFSELSARERLLKRSPKFEKDLGQIQDLELIRSSLIERMEQIGKTRSNMDVIEQQAVGFGAKISPENIEQFIERVPKEREPEKMLVDLNEKVATNTYDTVTKLEDLIDLMSDSDDVDKISEKIDKSNIENLSKGNIVDLLEKTARVREKAKDKEDYDTVISSNQIIDNLMSTLVDRVGFKDAVKAVESNFTILDKKFTKDEAIQRSFSGVGKEAFFDKLKQQSTGRKGFLGLFSKDSFEDSPARSEFKSIQEEAKDEGIMSSSNIAKATAAMTAFSYYQERGKSRVSEDLKDQLGAVNERLDKETNEDVRKGLLQERENIVSGLESATKKKDFYGMVKSLSGLSFVASELASSFGLTDDQVKKLGVGTVGLLASVKITSKILGEKLPESARKYEEALKEYTKGKMQGDVGLVDKAKVKFSGSSFKKDIEDELQKHTGTAGTVDYGEEFDKIYNRTDERTKEELKKYREKGPAFEKYADIQSGYRRDRADVFRETGKIVGPQYDKLKTEKRSKEYELFKDLDKSTKSDVKSSYPSFFDILNEEKEKAIKDSPKSNEAEKDASLLGSLFDKFLVGFGSLLDKITGKEDEVENKAAGGFIRGPGGPTSDSIPSFLSNGEFVVKASSTKSIGKGVLDYMNKRGKLPGMANGGFFGPQQNKPEGVITGPGKVGYELPEELLQKILESSGKSQKPMIKKSPEELLQSMLTSPGRPQSPIDNVPDKYKMYAAGGAIAPLPDHQRKRVSSEDLLELLPEKYKDKLLPEKFKDRGVKLPSIEDLKMYAAGGLISGHPKGFGLGGLFAKFLSKGKGAGGLGRTIGLGSTKGTKSSKVFGSFDRDMLDFYGPALLFSSFGFMPSESSDNLEFLGKMTGNSEEEIIEGLQKKYKDKSKKDIKNSLEKLDEISDLKTSFNTLTDKKISLADSGLSGMINEIGPPPNDLLKKQLNDLMERSKHEGNDIDDVAKRSRYYNYSIGYYMNKYKSEEDEDSVNYLKKLDGLITADRIKNRDAYTEALGNETRLYAKGGLISGYPNGFGAGSLISSGLFGLGKGAKKLKGMFDESDTISKLIAAAPLGVASNFIYDVVKSLFNGNEEDITSEKLVEFLNELSKNKEGEKNALPEMAGGGLLDKVGNKALTKVGLKKIPGIGLLAGLGFGAHRLIKGDVLGASGEVLSGGLSLIPGVGTSASLGMDAALISRDLKKMKGFAYGSYVSGTGGSKSDLVPAMLSNGEYVLNADSTKKIGVGTLKHMNEKGEVPGFADGGFVGAEERTEASGIDVDRTKQLIATYLATALADFTTKDNKGQIRYNELDDSINKQTEVLNDWLMKNSGDVQKVLDELSNNTNVTKKAGNKTEEMVKKSPLLDTSGKEITGALGELSKKTAEDLKVLDEELEKLKNTSAVNEFIENLNMMNDSLSLSIASIKANYENAGRFGKGNIINPDLAPLDEGRIRPDYDNPTQTERYFPGFSFFDVFDFTKQKDTGYVKDPELPQDRRDMSTGQRLYAQGGAPDPNYFDKKMAEFNKKSPLKKAENLLPDKDNPLTYVNPILSSGFGVAKELTKFVGKSLKDSIRPYADAEQDLNWFEQRKLSDEEQERYKKSFLGRQEYREAVGEYNKTGEVFGKLGGQLDKYSEMAEQQKQIMRQTEKGSSSYEVAKDKLELFREEMEKLSGVIDENKNSYRELGEQLKKVHEVGSIINNFKDSMYDLRKHEAAFETPSYKKVSTAGDKLFGGSHPLAPMAISPEQERMADSVGVDLTHLRSNKYDLREAQLKKKLYDPSISGEEYAKTYQQLQDLPEAKRRDIETYKQERETQQLRNQLKPVEALREELVRSKLSDEGAKYEEDVDNILSKIDRFTEKAYKIEGGSYRGVTGEMLEVLNNATTDLQNKAQEDLKGYDFNIDPSEKLGKPIESIETNVRAIKDKIVGTNNSVDSGVGFKESLRKTSDNFPGVSMVSKLFEKLGKAEFIGAGETAYGASKKAYGGGVDLLESLSPIGLANKAMSGPKEFIGAGETAYGASKKAYGGGVDLLESLSPIGLAKSLSPIGLYKNAMSEYKETIGAGSTMYDVAKPVYSGGVDLLESLSPIGLTKDAISSLGKLFQTLSGKESGGFISGPGGPKSDSIPAMLSNGEYVIKADSVNKLGIGSLKYMNEKGEIPKFAEGGSTGGFSDWFKKVKEVVSFWKDMATSEPVDRPDGPVQHPVEDILEDVKDRKEKLKEARGYAEGGSAGSSSSKDWFQKVKETIAFWWEMGFGEQKDRDELPEIDRIVPNIKERNERLKEARGYAEGGSVGKYSSSIDPALQSLTNVRDNLDFIINKKDVLPGAGDKTLGLLSTPQSKSLGLLSIPAGVEDDELKKLKARRYEAQKAIDFIMEGGKIDDQAFVATVNNLNKNNQRYSRQARDIKSKEDDDSLFGLDASKIGSKDPNYLARLLQDKEMSSPSLLGMSTIPEKHREIESKVNNDLTDSKRFSSFSKENKELYNEYRKHIINGEEDKLIELAKREGLISNIPNDVGLLQPSGLTGNKGNTIYAKEKLKDYFDNLNLSKERNKDLIEKILNSDFADSLRNAAKDKNIDEKVFSIFANLDDYKKEEDYDPRKYMEKIFGRVSTFAPSRIETKELKGYKKGGPVTETGPIFAHKGEYVLPKKFADGGFVDSLESNSGGMAFDLGLKSSSVKDAFSGILDELKDIRLKVDSDAKVKVDDNAVVKLDPEAKVKLDSDAKVEVAKPDWGVDVNLPDNKIEVNLSGAEERLSKAIKEALQTEVNVSVNNNASVGAERLDRFAEALNTIDRRLLDVKEELDSEIKIVKNNNQTSNIDSRIKEILNEKMGSVNVDVGNINSEVANVESRVTQLDHSVSVEINDINRKLEQLGNNAFNKM